MWPLLLDMTKEESLQHLRSLEIDAFSGLVNALRAQGTLSNEKLKLLQETGAILRISQERHKAEIRRVINDERLTTIAYHANDQRHSAEEWTDEGKRLMPLLPRMAPQTAYAAIADEVADCASLMNRQLPLPASTERKRPLSPPIAHNAAAPCDAASKSSVRPPEPDAKKRKQAEICLPASHLMAPPKISKIQQIYRQKSKNRLKEQLGKLKLAEVDGVEPPAGAPGAKGNSMQASTLPTIQKSQPGSIASDGTHLGLEQLARMRASSRPELRTSPSPTTITTADGHKLIVVSSSPKATIPPTTNLVQRPMKTLPTMRSLDQFKMTNATNMPAGATCSKVVAMRAPSGNSKVVPLSQMQVVNTKTGIRVVPIGGSKKAMGESMSFDTRSMSRRPPRRHSRMTSYDVIDCDADEEASCANDAHSENGENRANGIFSTAIQIMDGDEDGDAGNGAETPEFEYRHVQPEVFDEEVIDAEQMGIGNHVMANVNEYNSNDVCFDTNDILEHFNIGEKMVCQVGSEDTQQQDDDAEDKDIYFEERLEFDPAMIICDEHQQEIIIDGTIEDPPLETLNSHVCESENVAS